MRTARREDITDRLRHSDYVCPDFWLSHAESPVEIVCYLGERNPSCLLTKMETPGEAPGGYNTSR